jgi:predicted alpha/beta superfamily hydrolase
MIVVAVGMPRDAPKDEFQMRRTYYFIPDVPRGFRGVGGDLVRQQIEAYDEHAKTTGLPSAREQGGAPKFLEFLLDTLRPALSREYRMSGEHVLFGDSAGGFFCMYALLSSPGSFDKYICGSPSLYWGDYELFRMEQSYAQTHKDLPAKIFFGAGEAEVLEGGPISAVGIVSSMTRMAEILESRGYPSLKLSVRLFPGVDHESAVVSNLTWGLRTSWEIAK